MFNKWFKEITFINKLRFLLISFSLIVSLIALTSANIIMIDVIKQQLQSDFGNYVKIYEKSIERKFDELDNLIKIVISEPIIRAQLSLANNQDFDFGLGTNNISAFQKVHHVFKSADFRWKQSYEVFVVVNSEGQLIFSNVSPDTHSIDLKNNLLVKTTLQQGWSGGLWSADSIGEGSNFIFPKDQNKTIFLIMARNLYVGGKLIGAIIAGYKSANTLVEPFSNIFDGKIDFIAPNLIESESTIFAKKIINVQKLVYFPKSISSESNKVLGGIRFEKSIHNQLQILQDELKIAFGIIFLIIFLIIILTSNFFAQILTKPLKLITQKIRQFSQGNDYVTINITSNDEFGVLSAAFNSMIQGFRLSKIDPLTELSNRRHFETVFEKYWQRKTLTANSDLSIAIVDADHFKKINDNYGHLVGDQVLRALGKCLSLSVRPQDLVARFGGEEFIVLLPESDLEKAQLACERLRSKIENLKIAGDFKGSISITVSIGLASYSPDMNQKEDLIEKADKALYQAKSQGRNQVVSL